MSDLELQAMTDLAAERFRRVKELEKAANIYAQNGADYRRRIAELAADANRVIEQVKVLEQTILEVAHAQQCGADWYTKGENGLYAQVAMWVQRGQTAINEIKDLAPPEDSELQHWFDKLHCPPEDV